jgi:hypothetical protein
MQEKLKVLKGIFIYADRFMQESTREQNAAPGWEGGGGGGVAAI